MFRLLLAWVAVVGTSYVWLDCDPYPEYWDLIAGMTIGMLLAHGVRKR